MQNLLKQIRSTTKFVVENSEFVKINHERVIAFAQEFDHGDVKHWLGAAPYDLSHLSDEDKLHFVIFLNALSFSYWGEPKWTIEYKGKKHDGSWGMILALGRGIEDGVSIFDFKYCSQISKEDFANLLRASVEIPLFEERWKILQEVGSNMITKFDGRASNLVKTAKGDAQKLLELIVQNFPSFSDTSFYKEKEIYFYKRAQLLVADIYQIFDGRSHGALKNTDQLTACADYKLPQILRKLDILEYAPALAKKVDAETEIMHDAQEEVEIRANTIWAVEFIKEEVKKRNQNIVSFEVNDHLWLATQEKFDDDKPYHRTRTTAY